MGLAEGRKTSPEWNVNILVQSHNMRAVLMLHARHGDGNWLLPGGQRLEDETVGEGATRCLLRDTGHERSMWQVLAVDSCTIEDTTVNVGELRLVIYGGVLSKDEERTLALPDTASSDYSTMALIPYKR
ncbi:NUDIX domain-containing protein [Streptomyces zagrosensis]|uniref:ADP-ribose pyrophosphatase YjhB (NUDIX family) n=1 Tax=Streptomyces zagrosensis TaxID=1042984 RepID=A0A7W9Q7A0_9ACTN|nr:ADP-ribose pyrophosphatase YjhB (NUDIX family) [Streptomyces zagrosensis]